MVYDKTIRNGKGWDSWNHRSRNATLAYASGEQPMSKWRAMSKAEFVDCILQIGDRYDIEGLAQALLRQSKSDLLFNYLKPEGWHHVGSGRLTREVDFFSVNAALLVTEVITDGDRKAAEAAEAKAKQAEILQKKRDAKTEAYLAACKKREETDYQLRKPQLLGALEAYAKKREKLGKDNSARALKGAVKAWFPTYDSVKDFAIVDRAINEFCAK